MSAVKTDNGTNENANQETDQVTNIRIGVFSAASSKNFLKAIAAFNAVRSLDLITVSHFSKKNSERLRRLLSRKPSNEARESGSYAFHDNSILGSGDYVALYWNEQEWSLHSEIPFFLDQRHFGVLIKNSKNEQRLLLYLFLHCPLKDPENKIKIRAYEILHRIVYLIRNKYGPNVQVVITGDLNAEYDKLVEMSPSASGVAPWLDDEASRFTYLTPSVSGLENRNIVSARATGNRSNCLEQCPRINNEKITTVSRCDQSLLCTLLLDVNKDCQQVADESVKFSTVMVDDNDDDKGLKERGAESLTIGLFDGSAATGFISLAEGQSLDLIAVSDFTIKDDKKLHKLLATATPQRDSAVDFRDVNYSRGPFQRKLIKKAKVKNKLRSVLLRTEKDFNNTRCRQKLKNLIDDKTGLVTVHQSDEELNFDSPVSLSSVDDGRPYTEMQIIDKNMIVLRNILSWDAQPVDFFHIGRKSSLIPDYAALLRSQNGKCRDPDMIATERKRRKKKLSKKFRRVWDEPTSCNFPRDELQNSSDCTTSIEFRAKHSKDRNKWVRLTKQGKYTKSRGNYQRISSGFMTADQRRHMTERTSQKSGKSNLCETTSSNYSNPVKEKDWSLKKPEPGIRSRKYDIENCMASSKNPEKLTTKGRSKFFGSFSGSGETANIRQDVLPNSSDSSKHSLQADGKKVKVNEKYVAKPTNSESLKPRLKPRSKWTSEILSLDKGMMKDSSEDYCRLIKFKFAKDKKVVTTITNFTKRIKFNHQDCLRESSATSKSATTKKVRKISVPIKRKIFENKSREKFNSTIPEFKERGRLTLKSLGTEKAQKSDSRPKVIAAHCLAIYWNDNTWCFESEIPYVYEQRHCGVVLEHKRTGRQVLCLTINLPRQDSSIAFKSLRWIIGKYGDIDVLIAGNFAMGCDNLKRLLLRTKEIGQFSSVSLALDQGSCTSAERITSSDRIDPKYGNNIVFIHRQRLKEDELEGQRINYYRSEDFLVKKLCPS